MKTLKGRQAVERIAAFVLFAVMIGVVQYRARAWPASYGAYPDEPSHFLGGLMVHDFLLSGSIRPLQFATHYYLYQPFFAIGHWPPVFYLLEGVWMLLAGHTHLSIMVFNGAIAALVALLIFVAVRRRQPFLPAVLAGVLFLSIPAVRWSSTVLLTDLPAALFSVAAILVLGRYFDAQTRGWALAAGLAVSLALLTKYLAAFVLLPPLVLLIVDRRWRLLARPDFWMIPATIAALCGPWAVWARRYALFGFAENPGTIAERAVQALSVVYQDLGALLFIAGAVSFGWAVWHWGRLDSTERLLVLSAPCAFAFLVVAPEGIEARYLMSGYPYIAITIFLAAGSLAPLNRVVYAVVIVAVAGAGLLHTGIPQDSLPGEMTRRVARDLLALHPSGAILVPTPAEGPLIAELASEESVRSQILLIRPSKLLARENWNGSHYTMLEQDAAGIGALIGRYPIEVIIMAQRKNQGEAPHDVLLRQAIAGDPKWTLIRQYEESGMRWSVYRKPVPDHEPLEPLLTFLESRLPSIR